MKEGRAARLAPFFVGSPPMAGALALPMGALEAKVLGPCLRGDEWKNSQADEFVIQTSL